VRKNPARYATAVVAIAVLAATSGCDGNDAPELSTASTGTTGMDADVRILDISDDGRTIRASVSTSRYQEAEVLRVGESDEVVTIFVGLVPTELREGEARLPAGQRQIIEVTLERPLGERELAFRTTRSPESGGDAGSVRQQ